MDKSNQGSYREQQVIDLDVEWVHLLLAAKKAGIKTDEIRRFFHEKTVQAVQ
ncbi:anti-repressor SinI family protein [Paenibacillus sp. FSL K6-0276]|uniref:anti-repressor SinI family protein n=1 Tax=Paenibacillus sp. FSL K6-0276 TaxID=2921450 RepID=UPI0030EE3F13